MEGKVFTPHTRRSKNEMRKARLLLFPVFVPENHSLCFFFLLPSSERSREETPLALSLSLSLSPHLPNQLPVIVQVQRVARRRGDHVRARVPGQVEHLRREVARHRLGRVVVGAAPDDRPRRC